MRSQTTETPIARHIGLILRITAVAVVGLASPTGATAQAPAGPLVLKGHKGEVTAVSFAPDGDRILSCEGELRPPVLRRGLPPTDNSVRLWDARTGKLIRELKGHTRSVRCAAFSPDGALAVTCGDDFTTRVWDPAKGRALHVLTKGPQANEGHATAVAFSPDGKRVLVGTWRSLRLWDVKSGKEVRVLQQHPGSASSIAFTPDGKFVAVGSEDGVYLWEVATGKRVRQYGETGECVNAVAVSPDGRYLATAGGETKFKNSGTTTGGETAIHIWDLATAQHVRQLRGHKNRILTLAYSADGTRLASGGGFPFSAGADSPLDLAVRLWDPATAKELHRFDGHTAFVTGLSFAKDGKRLASSSGDGTVRIWEVKD